MLNIVLPIAGRGSRFAEQGYTLPKPLIPVHETPMIEVVVNNVRPRCEHRLIFVVLQSHLEESAMRETLNRIAPSGLIVSVQEVTEGAACTVLLARKMIDNDHPLMIVNTDQWVDENVNNYLDVMDRETADGLIMTMEANDPKWSYVGFDAAGNVNRVVEKQVISSAATVGWYNFRHGSDFVRAADAMIDKDVRCNGEFYVAPAYNEIIARGKRIVTANVGSEGCGMYGMGIPDDLELFLSLPISRIAAKVS